MTEQEWLSSEDPVAMLKWDGMTDRKLRLFACACSRYLLTNEIECPTCHGEKFVWEYYQLAHNEPRRREVHCSDCGGCPGTARRAIEVAERYADGLATEEERSNAYAHAFIESRNPSSGDFEREITLKCCGTLKELSGLLHWFSVSTKHEATQAQLLREIVGNPFRPMMLGDWWHNFMPFSGVRVNQIAPRLAQAAYNEREDTGHLDLRRLAILADALEEAECTNADILNHLHSTSNHMRGCWVLDLLLGKT